jgi:Tol biopolymer transport system component
MRFFAIWLIILPCMISGQEIVVLRRDTLSHGKEREYQPVAVSPDGKIILATSPGYAGLSAIDPITGEITVISSEAGAGYEPRFSEKGDKVFFRSDEYTGERKYSTLYEYDVVTTKRVVIDSAIRGLITPVITGGTLIWSSDDRERKLAIDEEPGKLEDKAIYLTLENLRPVIHRNGTSRVILPNGEGNYIWASLSPDKSKMVYNFNGRGTRVCDLDGNIIADAGRVHAPRWLNNETIVGMDDRDDGYRVTSSDIILFFPATGRKINLTSDSERIEMYPIPFPDGKRIVFQSNGGELHIIHLKVK